MITISKPHRLGILAITLTLLVVTVPLASASVDYNRTTTLPSNTLWFSDMESGSGTITAPGNTLNMFYSNDLDNGGKAGYNQTVSYDGQQSWWIKGVQTSSVTMKSDTRFTRTYTQNRLGEAVFFTYSQTCNSNALVTPFISLEFANSPVWATTNGHVMGRWQEGHLSYQCRNAAGATPGSWLINISNGAGSYTVQTLEQNVNYTAFDSTSFVQLKQNWIFAKVVIDRTTAQYIQVITPEKTYTCQDLIQKFGSCGMAEVSGNNPCSAGNCPTNEWGIEMGLDSTGPNAFTTDSFWDDLLITDETPGNPNIIQFGIVTASGLFRLILITTAMMYVSSGFGAVMRVFAKDKVPKFLGPKFIIVTGVVGTAGFLFMLIVGANLVQPACPVGFTCNG